MTRQINDPVEKVVAAGLEAAGVPYLHQSEMHPKDRPLDFYLPTFSIYIECKRMPTDRSSAPAPMSRSSTGEECAE